MKGKTMTTEYPEEINSLSFKYEEIKEHFKDFINHEGKDWVEEHKEDLSILALGTLGIIGTMIAFNSCAKCK